MLAVKLPGIQFNVFMYETRKKVLDFSRPYENYNVGKQFCNAPHHNKADFLTSCNKNFSKFCFTYELQNIELGCFMLQLTKNGLSYYTIQER